MKGFFNKILWIDLKQETFSYQEISDELLSATLGGKGLASSILLEKNQPGVDPLSADNLFMIATGPANGTPFWGSARFGVFSKSPLTGGFGESYCGGTLAPKIKGCGVDAVVLSGKADSLKFVAIDEQGVVFKDASPIRGAETQVAEKYIIEHSSPGASAMVIGPAGESLVRFACIKADRWRSLGRGGMGAVLGCKNIKGISFAGSIQCDLANEDLLKDLIKRITQVGKEAPVTELYKTLGTPMQVEATNANNCFPTRYWSKGHFSHWEKISARYMQKEFEVKATGCPFCFLRCTKNSVLKHGRHAGLEIEGPEYETIYALGGLHEIDSLEEVAWLNDICDRLGVDTMSGGNITAFAIEAYKRGKLDYAIDYNQPDRVAELLSLISSRQGVGDLLARGIKEAAAHLGLSEVAIHVKGLEPAGFEPRVLKGMGLSYATAARGACHLRGTFYKPELTGQIAKDQIEGKAKLLVDFEDRAALFDSLILCRFFRDFVLWEEIGELVKATTGMNYTKEQLADLANRTTNRTRAFNKREGLGADSDTLPYRFLNEATEEGATLKREELDKMISDYNTLRGDRV
jgi:aldehyde:ferredoxin oxidoreductase